MKTFIKLFLVLLCTGCQSDDLSEKSTQQVITLIENPNVIEVNKIIEEAGEFLESKFESSGNITLRTQKISDMDATVNQINYRVQISEYQKYNKVVEQEVPVYTIKYKDKDGKPSGTVISIGDERFERKIMAYNEEEEMDISAIKDFADFFEDMVTGYIHRIINTTTINQ